MKNTNLFRRKTVDQILAEVKLQEDHASGELVRNLTLRDLVSMGIAAIIGAGIFSTIGNASAAGGPAVSLLFIFTAIACVFSAMCYAQFASTIPISGSAYTYAYASFGELVAWIIGWDLLMEYAIGNIAVAISWSDYFTGLLVGMGLDVPLYLTMDFLSASRGHDVVTELLNQGKPLSEASALQVAGYEAWNTAPSIGGLKLVADLPALLITFFVTVLVYIGIKESKTTGNILVLIKLVVVLLVIAVGSFYIQPSNWSPFAPNGISGVLKGVSAVFFSYIGFDAISTTAEECKNPQRDLPKAMLYTLLICTVLYVLITLVLTGMVNYTELAVGDPLAFVFDRVNLNFMAGIISVSAIVALTSVLLVFQLGQPRIWMSMSRDGLLPKAFSKIHPRFNTPSFSTVVTGLVVAIPALFMNLTEVTDLTSIGTLFAFVLVCGGVLLLDKTEKVPGRFKVPYINGKYIVPALLMGITLYIFLNNREMITHFFTINQVEGNFWDVLEHKILAILFIVVSIWISWLTFSKNLSLIPVLGLLTNLYLMTELGITNWSRFLAWLLLGLVIYFSYSYRNSKLGKLQHRTNR
ncbi:amino acid permease [Rhodocytophaga aerolata]|uniref:Amino acid permease n=2 Tax=Rhodocytophaga aerolata TaxID=455078 RepID=A0ABT8R1B0_9BACT|nr:amino acid permease [Rhodocytophaga aerolata]MDO1445882.1 amino acid permease [Rhodocytophaga aerolata]